jgi:hypothetical protein
MWQTVLENLIPTIFVVVTPVLTMFVSVLLRRLAKKWHMEGALKYDDKVDELVIKGIKAVEQKSLTAVRRGGEMTDGQKKLDEAMKFVNAQLVAMKLPQKAATELSMLVESRLFDGAKAKEMGGVVVSQPDVAAKAAVTAPVTP